MDKNNPQTVSDKILDRFLTSLVDEKGFEETAVRLRKTIFEDKSTNENSIRNALFGESDT